MDTLLSLLVSLCTHTSLLAFGWFLHKQITDIPPTPKLVVSLGDAVLVRLPSTSSTTWTYGTITGFSGGQYLPYKITLPDGTIVYSDGTNLAEAPVQEPPVLPEDPQVTYRDLARK